MSAKYVLNGRNYLKKIPVALMTVIILFSYCRSTGFVLQVMADQEDEGFSQTIIARGERCAGHFYYDQLKKMNRSEACRRYYRYIDDFCKRLISYDQDLEHDEYVITFDKNSPVSWKPDRSGLQDSDWIHVMNMYNADHPYYFFMDLALLDGDQLKIVYTFDFDRASERKKIFTKINQYIDSYRDAEEIDDLYERAKYIHDNLCLNMTYAHDIYAYTSTGWTNNIYGPVFYKTGVCEAYSKTYQMLTGYYGMESACVSGTGNDAAHMWNILRLSDNRYYYVDATWDDSLDGENEWSDQFREEYFAVGSEKLDRNHHRDVNSEFIHTGIGEPLESLEIPYLSEITFDPDQPLDIVETTDVEIDETETIETETTLMEEAITEKKETSSVETFHETEKESAVDRDMPEETKSGSKTMVMIIMAGAAVIAVVILIIRKSL